MNQLFVADDCGKEIGFCAFWIKFQSAIWIILCVLKKGFSLAHKTLVLLFSSWFYVLGVKRQSCLALMLQQIKHDAVSGSSQRVNRNWVAIVEPQINRSFDLRNHSFQFGDSKFRHLSNEPISLTMPASILILAPAAIFHFASVNLALWCGHHALCQRLEVFKCGWFCFLAHCGWSWSSSIEASFRDTSIIPALSMIPLTLNRSVLFISGKRSWPSVGRMEPIVAMSCDVHRDTEQFSQKPQLSALRIAEPQKTARRSQPE